MIALLALFTIAAIVTIVICLNVFTDLIGLHQHLQYAWAQIDVVLKQTAKEIPQLSHVIEVQTNSTPRVLTELEIARSRFEQATSLTDKISSSFEMSYALSKLLNLDQQYPELTNSAHYRGLCDRVRALAAALGHRRETYNLIVDQYNEALVQVPNVWAAKLMKFESRSFFHESSEMHDFEKSA